MFIRIFPRSRIFHSASISHASRNTLFLIIAIKTVPAVRGRTCASSRSIYTIFLPPCFPTLSLPRPSRPLVSLLNYPSARSCRAKLGCGRRSRDTTPHHRHVGGRKEFQRMPGMEFWYREENGRRGAAPRRSRQEAGRRRCVRDRRDIY